MFETIVKQMLQFNDQCVFNIISITVRYSNNFIFVLSVRHLRAEFRDYNKAAVFIDGRFKNEHREFIHINGHWRNSYIYISTNRIFIHLNLMFRFQGNFWRDGDIYIAKEI